MPYPGIHTTFAGSLHEVIGEIHSFDAWLKERSLIKLIRSTFIRKDGAGAPPPPLHLLRVSSLHIRELNPYKFCRTVKEHYVLETPFCFENQGLTKQVPGSENCPSHNSVRLSAYAVLGSIIGWTEEAMDYILGG